MGAAGRRRWRAVSRPAAGVGRGHDRWARFDGRRGRRVSGRARHATTGRAEGRGSIGRRHGAGRRDRGAAAGITLAREAAGHPVRGRPPRAARRGRGRWPPHRRAPARRSPVGRRPPWYRSHGERTRLPCPLLSGADLVGTPHRLGRIVRGDRRRRDVRARRTPLVRDSGALVLRRLALARLGRDGRRSRDPGGRPLGARPAEPRFVTADRARGVAGRAGRGPAPGEDAALDAGAGGGGDRGGAWLAIGLAPRPGPRPDRSGLGRRAAARAARAAPLGGHDGQARCPGRRARPEPDVPGRGGHDPAQRRHDVAARRRNRASD